MNASNLFSAGMANVDAYGWQTYVNRKLTEIEDKLRLLEVATGGVKCVFESLSPEDRMKPMGISCPCKRCTPHSLT